MATTTKHETWEYRITLKPGDEVSVINAKTNRPMAGRWTFVAHVVTDTSEWIDVRQEAREIVRSFPTDRIEPKGR